MWAAPTTFRAASRSLAASATISSAIVPPQRRTSGATARPCTSAPPSSSEGADSRPSLKPERANLRESPVVHAPECYESSACEPCESCRSHPAERRPVRMALRGIDGRQQNQWRSLQQRLTQFDAVMHARRTAVLFVDEGQRADRSELPEPAQQLLTIALRHVAADQEHAGAGRQLPENRPSALLNRPIYDQPLA